MTIDKSSVNKILLIKLRGIGDVILSTVVLENLTSHFPNASIDFLTEKPSEQLLNELPVINKVHLFTRKDIWGRLKLIRSIRKEKYDYIFDFYSNPFTAQLTYLSRAKYRAGFPYKGRKYAYNLFGPEERGIHHAADLHLKFLERVGIKANRKELIAAISVEASSFSSEYFKNNFDDGDFIVGVSPSGGWPSKKCDPVKFAEIADEIVKKYNAKMLVVWGPDDEKECDEIISLMKNEAIKAPNTTIQQMAAFISKCDMLIANDSGPMHISTAVQTPTLSIHGPTDPKLQGPYGDKHEWINKSDLHCIICNLLECPYNHECFLELNTNDVMRKVDSLIKKNNLK